MDSLPLDSLPVDEALPRLKAALEARNAAVLVAPPGAGKTTRVPLALLDAPWLGAAKIVMQEPRRLAARAAARRMAQSLGEPVGETLGYRVRLDTRVGPRTRIEVLTEGILTRLLQEDPGLAGVAAVIFDEVHERSLQGDLGLALCLEARAALRPELAQLQAGVVVEGERLAARAARELRRGARHAWLEIVLDEGRNRQIRRLLEAQGVAVLRLVRMAIGSVRLGDLPKGAWRPLRPEEVAALAPTD